MSDNLPDPAKFKPPIHRVVKYELYRLLTGQTLTRRDMLVAGGAASTAIAADKIFGWGLNMFAKEKGAQAAAGAGATGVQVANSAEYKQSTRPRSGRTK